MALKIYKQLPGQAAAMRAAHKTKKASAVPEMSFSEKVVQLALSVPPGRVTTYGHLARAAGGGAMAAQSITNILGKAWQAGQKDIPFHRIVYADGRIWVDPAHDKERRRRYKEEGITLDSHDRIQNFRDVLVNF